MATEIIPAKGDHKAIHFQKGGLHNTTHTAQGTKIPHSKILAALHGKYGSKGVKQANFMMNVLRGNK